jgi:hypothetical protein
MWNLNIIIKEVVEGTDVDSKKIQRCAYGRFGRTNKPVSKVK